MFSKCLNVNIDLTKVLIYMKVLIKRSDLQLVYQSLKFNVLPARLMAELSVKTSIVKVLLCDLLNNNLRPPGGYLKTTTIKYSF